MYVAVVAARACAAVGVSLLSAYVANAALEADHMKMSLAKSFG